MLSLDPMTIPLFNKHTCSLTEDVYKLLAMPSSRFALHGPEHYGKTTLLKTVSRDLGIEVICVISFFHTGCKVI